MDFVQPAEEESEAEVRREDQDAINKFARLNARLHELRDERDLIKVSSYYLQSKTKQKKSIFFARFIFAVKMSYNRLPFFIVCVML